MVRCLIILWLYISVLSIDKSLRSACDRLDALLRPLELLNLPNGIRASFNAVIQQHCAKLAIS